MADTSWGGFKALESGLGQSGYSKPNWFQSFDMGKTMNNITGGFGDMMSGANKHFADNKDVYNFGATLGIAGGNYMMQDKAAKEAKRMNDFYMGNTIRERNRQEDQEDTYAASFKNSNLNGMYGA